MGGLNTLVLLTQFINDGSAVKASQMLPVEYDKKPSERSMKKILMKHLDALVVTTLLACCFWL